jgi:hypothetical protein
MSLIDRVKELRKLEAKATCGEWLPGDLETECIAGNYGKGDVVLRHTNGGSIPSREDTDLICVLRNAAPELLSILSEIRPGDADEIDYAIQELSRIFGLDNVADTIDVLRRYHRIAAAMEAENI